MKIPTAVLLCACFLTLLAPTSGLHAADMQTATPAPLVASYESLADAILAAKKTEWNLVHSILAATYEHAQGVVGVAREKIQSGKPAAAELEVLAALVTQLGNEGDAAVAAVRKRLLEGGHHHHADDGQKGVYDEGFVIVTREAKKVFLEAGKALGKLAASPDRERLDAEWGRVTREFAQLHPHAGN